MRLKEAEIKPSGKVMARVISIASKSGVSGKVSQDTLTVCKIIENNYSGFVQGSHNPGKEVQ